MKKRMKKIICRIFLCAVFFCIVRAGLDKVAVSVDLAGKIKSGISVFVTGVTTIILPRFAEYLKIILDRKKDKSEIGVAITDVSEIRKSKRPNDVLEVPLGNRSKYFMYICATVKNTGNYEIIRLMINDQPYKAAIETKQTISFRFKVYCENNKKVKEKHLVEIEFEDEKNNLYKKRYKLKIFPEKKDALIKRVTL